MNLVLPNRYRLHHDPLLGEGGMGRVLRAHDVMLDVPVALKIVRPDLAEDPRFRKLFELEIRISARFAHPHIVPLHDHGLAPDGTPYLGLAFADAGSFARLRDQILSWEELKRLSLQVLAALGHLHAREILHRDIKPENLLLHTDTHGRVHTWLADLGLAKASSSLIKRKGRTEGTPGFMSPEQQEGRVREYGPATDLYSFGVVLWDLLTGNLPFGEEHTAATAPLPSFVPRTGLEVPHGLEEVLRNLLHPEPLNRYDLAADLIHEIQTLDTLPQSERTSAPQPPLIYRKPPPLPLPSSPPQEVGYGARARASLSLFALRELPLVARDTPRQRLWDAARHVAEQHSAQVVVVVGEAGTGKTRLVESVAMALEEGGWAEVVRLRYQHPSGKEDGYPGAARNLLRPWHETRKGMVERLKRKRAREHATTPDIEHEEAERLARWCGLLEQEEAPVQAVVGLRELHRHLDARSWRGLSCLVLDDAQWAREDKDGLSIIETLLEAERAEHHRPLLALVTVRTEELSSDPILAKKVDELISAGAQRLDLPRLNRNETKQLLDECLTLHPDLIDKVIERCEGNPLFARQLLLEWSERGWLVDLGGLEFGLEDGVDTDQVLPKDATALFRERTKGLAQASGTPEAFRDALHMTALAGSTLPRTLLKILMDDMAPFALGCGLWQSTGDQVRFDSSMLHQAVRAEAECRADCSTLHQKLSRAWRAYAEQTGQKADLYIGRHACHGKDEAFALKHLLPACELAWVRGQSRRLEEASRLVLPITLSSACTPADAAAGHLWRARACELQGEWKEAHASFHRALDAFLATGDMVGQTQAHRGVAVTAMRLGQFDVAEPHHNDAIECARQGKLPVLEAEAIAEKAWLEQQKRNFEGANILFTQAVSRLDQQGETRGVAHAMLGQAFVHRRTGSFEDSDALYQEAAESFVEGEDPLGETRAKIGRALVAIQQQQDDMAAQLLDEALSQSEELGSTPLLMQARLGQADLLRHQGQTLEASAIYANIEAWAVRNQELETTILTALRRAILALKRNDVDACYQHLNVASSWLDKAPGHWLWATYRLMVANYVTLCDDAENAWSWLWSATEFGLKDTVDRDNAACLVSILEHAQQHDWPKVVSLADRLVQEQLTRLGDHDQLAHIRALRAPSDPKNT